MTNEEFRSRVVTRIKNVKSFLDVPSLARNLEVILELLNSNFYKFYINFYCN